MYITSHLSSHSKISVCILIYCTWLPIDIKNSARNYHTLVVTSWNHWLWGLSKQVGLSSTQMHLFVTILDEVGDSLCKHKFWPCPSTVPKWRFVADKVFQELCLLLHSFARLAGDPSPIAFMHVPLPTNLICWPSWIHLLWSPQSPSSSSLFLFTFTHCPLSGWYIM